MSRGAHPLDDQILAVLRDAEGFPLSTQDVAASLGAPPGSNRAYAVLRRLWILTGRSPAVVHHQRITGWRPIYWSAAPTQLELEPGYVWPGEP